MRLNNIEVKFSFTNADDMAKYEEAQKYVVEETSNREKKEMSISQSIRAEIEIIDKFFEMIFGKEISQKLFKEKGELGERLNVYSEMVEKANKEKETYQSIFDKYSPNRLKKV